MHFYAHSEGNEVLVFISSILKPRGILFCILTYICLSSSAWAITYDSPWTEGKYLDTLRMNAELDNYNREKQTKLATEAYNYALLNAYNQKAVNEYAKADSISGQWPQVVLTTLPDYYCGMPTADLVLHSTVWVPAIQGLSILAQKSYDLKTHTSTLTATEMKAITKVVAVAMNGLNFFVQRDKQSISANSWAFYYRVPASCPINASLNGKTAPLNYISSAGRLSFELEQFFNLPTEILNSVSPSFASNRQIYINNMREITDKTTAYVLSQIKKDSMQASYWYYLPGGRIDDNSHAEITVNWLARIRRYGRVEASVVYGLLNAFARQYSTGPTQTFSHLSMTQFLDWRGTYFATKSLSLWTELMVFDCSLIDNFNTLISTPVPDLSSGKVLAPNCDSYVTLRFSYAKKMLCKK